MNAPPTGSVSANLSLQATRGRIARLMLTKPLRGERCVIALVSHCQTRERRAWHERRNVDQLHGKRALLTFAPSLLLELSIGKTRGCVNSHYGTIGSDSADRGLRC